MFPSKIWKHFIHFRVKKLEINCNGFTLRVEEYNVFYSLWHVFRLFLLNLIRDFSLGRLKMKKNKFIYQCTNKTFQSQGSAGPLNTQCTRHHTTYPYGNPNILQPFGGFWRQTRTKLNHSWQTEGTGRKRVREYRSVHTVR